MIEVGDIVSFTDTGWKRLYDSIETDALIVVYLSSNEEIQNFCLNKLVDSQGQNMWLSLRQMRTMLKSLS